MGCYSSFRLAQSLAVNHDFTMNTGYQGWIGLSPAGQQQLSLLRMGLLAPEEAALPAAGQATAAVLIPIFERANQLHIVYITRSHLVGSHRGQVAFPGGKVDPGDRTLAAAALREAHEEVGIAPESVELLGAFPTMCTATTGMAVASFAGVIPAGLELRAEPSEVADVFSVSLSDLSDPANRTIYDLRREGLLWKFPAINCGGRILWGLTYRLTVNLLEMIG
jgi:8-oxo-dGTP pyrophosphatase MutT (NUDIX family)